MKKASLVIETGFDESGQAWSAGYLLHFSHTLPSLAAFTQQGCSHSLPAFLALSQQPPGLISAANVEAAMAKATARMVVSFMMQYVFRVSAGGRMSPPARMPEENCLSCAKPNCPNRGPLVEHKHARE